MLTMNFFWIVTVAPTRVAVRVTILFETQRKKKHVDSKHQAARSYKYPMNYSNKGETFAFCKVCIVDFSVADEGVHQIIRHCLTQISMLTDQIIRHSLTQISMLTDQIIRHSLTQISMLTDQGTVHTQLLCKMCCYVQCETHNVY